MYISIYLSILYLNNVFHILVYMYFTSFIRFITKCLLLDSCKWYVLNFNSHLFFASIQKSNNFYMTFYPSFLLRSNSFSVNSIDFLHNWSCHLEIQFYFLFQVYDISFLCLIALSRTSSTMWNRSVENRCPCIIPELRGKTF